MRIIRACAVQFPNFEADFVPRLNQALLARHSAAILYGQGRTLVEARLQPSKDFEIEAIKSLTIDRQRQSLWLTSQDGAIPLDSKGTLLKDVHLAIFECIYFRWTDTEYLSREVLLNRMPRVSIPLLQQLGTSKLAPRRAGLALSSPYRETEIHRALRAAHKVLQLLFPPACLQTQSPPWT